EGNDISLGPALANEARRDEFAGLDRALENRPGDGGADHRRVEQGLGIGELATCLLKLSAHRVDLFLARADPDQFVVSAERLHAGRLDVKPADAVVQVLL